MLPTAVIPEAASPEESVEIELGDPELPLLTEVDSRLNACRYDSEARKMTVEIEAFNGHETVLRFISPHEPKEIVVEPEPLTRKSSVKIGGSYYYIELTVTCKGPEHRVYVYF